MDKLKKLLGEELYNQIVSKLGNTKIDIVNDGNWIPKQKFDQANEQVKELKGQLSERDKQLEDLKKKAKDSEELQTKISELEETNKQTKKEYEEKIFKQQKDFAITRALTDAGARNLKAVMALLDLEAIKVDGKELLGLKEQLDKIKETDSYLFGEDGGVGGRKPHPPGPGQKPTTKKFAELSSKERIELKEENPQLYKSMREEHLNTI